VENFDCLKSNRCRRTINKLYPAIRVAMDSRNDVYGEDLYAECKQKLRDTVVLGALLRRLDAAAVVLDWVGGKNLATARLLRKVSLRQPRLLHPWPKAIGQRRPPAIGRP